jgi:hypothetical protein
MRECLQCGEVNQTGARFCVVCGIPLPGALAAEPAPDGPPVAAAAAPVPAVALPGGTGRPKASASLDSVALSRDPGNDIPLDGPRTLVGFLVSYDGAELGQYWPIHQGRNVLGRLGAATGLDIEIAHPTTSSLHAVLLGGARPGRVLVEDSGSTNGTFVNDNPIAPGRRWELRDGDKVRFGLFNTIVKVIQS